jgi:signal transduction histidine kinase
MNETAVLAAQVGVLVVLIVGNSLFLSWRYRKKDWALRYTAKALDATVHFLQAMNELPLGLPAPDLQEHLWNRLQDIFRPMRVRSRLWIVDKEWKTLRGVGHLQGQKQTTQHLPMSACPAMSEKRLFEYARGRTLECSSEKFSYGKHLCIPLVDGRDSFGILFLATDSAKAWDPQELHLFNVLAQAIALCMQRRSMFDKLQEKISELHFSFEVGTSALSAFDGSIQSLKETIEHILDAVLSVLKVDRVAFMEWNPEKRALITECVRGEVNLAQTPLKLAWGEGFAGWALQTGESYWAEYATGDPHFVRGNHEIATLLCVPVYSMSREPLGVINAVMIRNARRFSAREIQFLTSLSRLAGMAIENARLHDSSRQNISHLNQVSQLKSDFLSLVSHDLRGPLTGVRGFAEILKQQTAGPLNTSQLEMLEQLERQVDHQERMVDDLLDLARMEKGRLSVFPRETDLSALLKEEVDKAQSTAKERGITMELVISPNENLSAVFIDPGRMRQVTWNLVHNALKFTPEGGQVTVSANATEPHVIVEVRDSGAGLSPETQEKIFEKFFQITPGGSKGAQGLGLGLAICKEIIQAHGGKIEAYSAGIGQGTQMRITLPYKMAA